MIMHSDSAKVFFIETLNPKQKLQLFTAISSEKYMNEGGFGYL